MEELAAQQLQQQAEADFEAGRARDAAAAPSATSEAAAAGALALGATSVPLAIASSCRYAVLLLLPPPLLMHIMSENWRELSGIVRHFVVHGLTSGDKRLVLVSTGYLDWSMLAFTRYYIEWIRRMSRSSTRQPHTRAVMTS